MRLENLKSLLFSPQMRTTPQQRRNSYLILASAPSLFYLYHSRLSLLYAVPGGSRLLLLCLNVSSQMEKKGGGRELAATPRYFWWQILDSNQLGCRYNNKTSSNLTPALMWRNISLSGSISFRLPCFCFLYSADLKPLATPYETSLDHRWIFFYDATFEPLGETLKGAPPGTWP